VKGKLKRALIPAAPLFALLLGALSAGATDSKASPWYRVELERGETSDGYLWAVGASGPRHQPLRTICNVTVTVSPPNEEAGYVESSNGIACGKLLRPEESSMESFTLGSGAAEMRIKAVLYRPRVRKVTYRLDGGERRVYLTQVPEIANRVAKGIPVFRYMVATFEGDPCISRITSFDRAGVVLMTERHPYGACDPPR
jgi:hypothetical protein